MNSYSYALKTRSKTLLTFLEFRKNLFPFFPKYISCLCPWHTRNHVLLPTNLICTEQYGDNFPIPSNYFLRTSFWISVSIITFVRKYRCVIKEEAYEYSHFKHCNHKLSFCNNYCRDYRGSIFL